MLAGPIRQFGFVVADLDAAIEAWLSLGVGPWFTLRDVNQGEGTYLGEPNAPTLSIGFANSGPTQLELIEPADDGERSAARDFLARGQEGLNHLAWWTADFAGTVAGLDWPMVQHSTAGGVAEFAYFDPGRPDGLLVEVMELNDATTWMVEAVRVGAENWDGRTDPVRPLF